MSFKRCCALSWLIVCLAGCGGGSAGNGGSGGGGGTGTSTSVTFTFRGATPTAVAAKIGSGAFTAQTLSSGALTLSIPSGTSTFAVAFACPPISVTSGGTQIGQTGRESVIEASTLDGTSFTESCAVSPQSIPSGTLTGTVDASAIAAASFVTLNAQSGTSSASISSSTPLANFNLAAPAGTDRVEVLAFQSGLQNGTESTSLVAARNFPSQTVPGALNGGSPVILSTADETTAAPITYTNVPSGFTGPSTLCFFEMAGGGTFLVADAATTQYPVLPAGAVQTGDSYVFEAIARNGLQTVSSFSYTSAGGPVSFTLPTPWSYAGPTPAALPTFNFNYAGFTGKSGVTEAASIGWSVATFSENTISAIATANYQNSTTSLAIPDLSGIAGFWASPASGTQIAWSAEISQNSWGGVLQTAPSTATANIVLNGGTYTVP